MTRLEPQLMRLMSVAEAFPGNPLGLPQSGSVLGADGGSPLKLPDSMPVQPKLLHELIRQLR